MRKIIADIFALLVFSTLGSMIVEILIAGMAFNQSLRVRLTAVPFIVIFARPYGLFRDWVFKVTRANQKGKVRKALADILAFASFQVPQYTLVLKLSGANFHQIIAACGTATLLSLFAGRPMGIFLEFSRWLFKIKKEAL
jgi:hypothetical protein